MFREHSATPTDHALNQLASILSEDASTAAEELAQEAKKNGEQTQINVMVGAKPRQTLAAEFVLAFTDNLRLFADLKLSPSEMRLLALVLKTMEFGNLLNFSQAAAGKALGFGKAHTSRLFQSLRRKGLFVEHDGHTYANPRLFLKGLPHRLDAAKVAALREVSASAQAQVDGITYAQTLR